MNEPKSSPIPYRVIYSGRVRDELKRLLARAAISGLGQQVLAAVKEIDSRLKIYPQFGEPPRDLKTVRETIWIGTIPPLLFNTQ